MADIFTTLLQVAILKRAAVMEQWLVNHSDHYPGPRLGISRDYLTAMSHCTCGESFEVTLNINITTKVMPKI